MFFLTRVALGSEPTVVIHWATTNFLNDPELLKDRNGNPLSAGANGNGNGHVVTLGYFDLATNDSLENHFNGSWVPLTQGTRVGDSSTGYGFSDGMFSFTTVFRRYSDQVVVFPFEPASYNVTAPFPIGTSYGGMVTAPNPGTPICIRFYDDVTTGPSARYNTVTGTGWEWPAFSGGIPSNLYLKIASGTPHTGSEWRYGNYFEDSDNNFSTALELQVYLTVNLDGQGSVGPLNPSYNYGSVVPIEAIPDNHMEFVEWQGSGIDQVNSQETTILMTADRNITAVFQPKSYNVTINHQNKGTTSGSGVHQYGTTIDINATPDPGYQFSHWEGAGPDSNTSASTTLTIQQDHALIAVFEPIAYSISVNGAIGGSASALENPPYFFDSNYTLQASPSFGYNFTHWSSSTGSLDLLDSTSDSVTTFLVQGQASYTANFSLVMHELEVLMDTGGASVSPATGSHSALSMVTVEATPLTGYDFAGWEDPSLVLVDPSQSTTEANMSEAGGNVTITATFIKKTYDVNVSESTGGNISLENPSGPWEHFGVYELNASAQTGYTFSEWAGDVNSTNSLLSGVNEPINKLGIAGPVSLTAVFALNDYEIELIVIEGGNATGAGRYTIHDAPNIQASPDEGWHFESWSGERLDLLIAPTSASSLVNLVGAPLNLSYTANFARDVYDFNVSVDGNGSVNDSSFISMTPDSGTLIELTAEPDVGWHFENWSGYPLDSPNDANISFIPSSSGSLTANFEINYHTLDLSASLGGEVNGSGSYAYGSIVPIQAQPSPGFMFNGWTGDVGFLDQNNSSSAILIPDRNLSVVAQFVPIPLSISTTIVGTGEINPAGGVFDMGSEAILTATPGGPEDSAPRGHQLEKWVLFSSSGESSSSTSNPLYITMDSNFTVTAVFSPIPPDMVELNLLSDPANGGSLFDDPDARVWNVATDLIEREIHATANPAFSFIGWSSSPQGLNFSPSWKSASVSTSPEANSTITAHFSNITHKVLIDHDPGKGSTDGAGSGILTATSRTLTATPSENYEFDYWSIDKTIPYEVTRDSSTVNPSQSNLYVDENESPVLILIRGFTYSFNCTLENNEVLLFSTDLTGSLASSYETGVVRSESENGLVTFTVPVEAPDDLFYHGSTDLYSGNKIRIVSIADSEIIPFPNQPTITPYLEFDLSLQANFIGKEIAISVMSGEGGSVDGLNGQSSFIYGSTITLQATPDQHYEFDRWELPQFVESTSQSNLSFNLEQETSITAYFKPKTYQLSLMASPLGSGTVFSTSNQYSFSQGTSVSIQAVPLVGHKFVNWSGEVDNAVSASTQIVIDGNTTVTANFSETLVNISLTTVTLDINGSQIEQDAGRIIGGNSFSLGASPQFSAVPYEGYEFLHWEDESGNILSTSQTATLQITGFSELLAIFQQLVHEIEVTAMPTGKGIVEWLEKGSGENLTDQIIHGETISLIARPIDGYVFEKWTSSSGEIYQVGIPEIEIEVTKSLLINARFKPINPVELTITKSPADAGWTFGQGTFNQDKNHAIFAKPNPGFLFDRWEGLEIDDPSSANTQLDLNQNKNLTVYFRTDPDFDPSEYPLIDKLGLHNLSVVSSDNSKGSVSGSGIFGTGWAEIKAFAMEGNSFLRWEGASVESPHSENTFVFLTENAKITAVFKSDGEPLIANAQNLGSNWWQSEWMGTYWDGDNKWIFHSKLGWIYVYSQGNDSIWLWIEKLGAWCWTNTTRFPYLFNTSYDTWIWIDLPNSEKDSILFFRFDIGQSSGNWFFAQ